METLRKILFRENIKTVGFESLSLSELIAKPKDHNPFQPHRINFNTIIVITEGSVNHMLDFEEYKLEKNDCIVISHNQVHAFDAGSEYIGYAFLFTNDYLQNQLSRSSYFKVANLFNYHLSLSKHTVNEDLLADVKNLSKEFHYCKYALKSDILASFFSIVLLKLSSQNIYKISHQSNKGFEVFEQFRLLVEKEYPQSRNVKFYIKKIGVSHKHLNGICKRFTTKTAKEFIDYFIVLEIKRKLSSTSSSIKSICYNSGFDEPTNFQKYFKKHTRMTPFKFRSRIQG